MQRRAFIAAIPTAWLMAAGVEEVFAGRWRHRRSRTACGVQQRPAIPTPSVALHCLWTDTTSVTFLVGGRFSAHQLQRASDTQRSLDWHLPGGSLYWPLHDRCGCNNYGDGIGPAESLNQESYFSWPANNDPTEDDMFAAAQLIKERCDHIRSHHAGFTKVRLIGHSAGCNVCSMATHLLADYQIEHLVLLSPPTYLPNSSHPHRKFPKYYRYVFPNLSHIQGGEFVSVRPAGDSVLAGFAADNVRRHFRFDAFRRYPDANISRVPDTQELGRTEFVVSSPVNHWQPCNPTNWSDAIWTAIGCRPTPDSARPNPATPRAFGPAKSLRNRV